MIAIDLDGTLLCPAGTVRPRVKEAIHGVLATGAIVCFATGRSFAESRHVLEAVGHFQSAVFVGGAMVIDTDRALTVHRMGMQPAVASAVSGVLESMGHPVMALQDRSDLDYLISASPALDESTARWMQTYAARVQFVDRVADADHSHTIRMGVVGYGSRLDEAKARLQADFAGQVYCQTIGIHAGTQVLEIFDPAVNKWEGISHIARRHGISAKQIVAVGDEMNDMHMIRHAGLGVAMGNARPELQAAARRVIRGNHEDGLADFIEQLLGERRFAPPGTPRSAGESAA